MKRFLELIPEREVVAAYTKKVGDTPVVVEIHQGLDDLEKLLGGTVHEFHLKGSCNSVVAMVNMDLQEAKKEPFTYALQGLKLYGPVVFVGYAGNDYLKSLRERDFTNLNYYIEAAKKRAENERKEG